MYTDTVGSGKNNGEGAIEPRRVWGGQESSHNQFDGWGLGKFGDVGHELESIQKRSDRTDCAWIDQFKQADQSPGGIASRLLTEKLERLGEVRGRLEIVNRRKTEYEEKIVQLEQEIAEIRAIAAELQPEFPPAYDAQLIESADEDSL